MRSPMQDHFAKVPQANIVRSVFDRSFEHKTTFDGGYLVPIYLDEMLPGDVFRCRMSGFARLATPIKPIMDNMYLETFFFAVPYRLVWTNWEKFNGAQDNPGDSTSFTCPQMTGPNVASGGVANGSLSDYMGIPTGALSGGGGTTGITFNSFWHRAYNLIFNTWFKDENLDNNLVVDTGDGPDTYSNYTLQRRRKRHDYFTSCLPWPQKGTAVPLPLGTSAPVIGNGGDIYFQNSATAPDLRRMVMETVSQDMAYEGASMAQGFARLSTDSSKTGMIADLTSATAATVNSLRQAFQLQKMYERDARGGTRYIEILKSHFQVTSPDGRLQRPQYLGGGSTPINIHPVPQANAQNAAGTTTPQGNLSAFGTASFNGHGFTHAATEHELILGLVNVRANLTYQQGLPRMFSRRTRFDFFWPSLQFLGEQSVLNKEIYANLPDGTGAAQKDGVFGYQERFAEYKYKPSMVTGRFRSNYSTPLDMWHLAQNFSSQPVLNSTFMAETPPIDRVIAVNTEPHFLFDSVFDLKCARPMAVYSVPGNIDRF